MKSDAEFDSLRAELTTALNAATAEQMRRGVAAELEQAKRSIAAVIAAEYERKLKLAASAGSACRVCFERPETFM